MDEFKHSDLTALSILLINALSNIELIISIIVLLLTAAIQVIRLIKKIKNL